MRSRIRVSDLKIIIYIQLPERPCFRPSFFNPVGNIARRIPCFDGMSHCLRHRTHYITLL